ncbi:MAG: GNAT family N-acetyltransferase [Cyanobacteria bacterium J06626_6]
MDFHIRPADAKDMPAILALQALSLRALSAQTYSAAQIESLVRSQGAARVASFNAGDEVIYVACLGAEQHGATQLIGVVAFIAWRSQIGGLFVHPGYVRRGVARALMGQVELIAAQQQQSVMRVMSSLVAVPFYEAVGYSHLFSRTVCFEDSPVGCVEMAKTLDGQNLQALLLRQKLWTVGLVASSLMFVIVAVTLR